MHTYSLYICNKVIRIHNECGKFVRFCRGYIIQEPAPEPDYVICVSESEIEAQRILSPGYGVDMLGTDKAKGFRIYTDEKYIKTATLTNVAYYPKKTAFPIRCVMDKE